MGYFDFIGVIGGKNFGTQSKMHDWLGPIHEACPSANVGYWEWNDQQGWQMCQNRKHIALLPHSFAGFSTYLFAEEINIEDTQYVDCPRMGPTIDIVSFDPVRWNVEDDPRKLTGFDEQAIAQIINQNPFKVPGSVQSWISYYVPGGIVSSLITPTDGVNFDNIQVDGTSHDGVIGLKMPTAIDWLKKLDARAV